MKKIAVWSDLDLDGAGTQLLLRWLNPTANITQLGSTISGIRKDMQKWLKTNSISDYDEFYVTDLDTTSVRELIDFSNVFIIDHHESHDDAAEKYEEATVYVDGEYSSATRLLYDIFKSKADKLTTAQKLLLSIIDDYDSYALKFPISKQLNDLYWNMKGNRVAAFCEKYNEGFVGLSDEDKMILIEHRKNVDDVCSKLEIFTGEIDGYTAAATFCSKYHNDVTEFVLNKTNCDVVMLVNTLRSVVSFRKSPTCSANLSNIAYDLGGGGGHGGAAGCSLTEKFMENIRNFK